MTCAGTENHASSIKMKEQIRKKIELILKENIMPALIGGLALFVVFYNLEVTPANVAMFSSLGASTVILSSFPTKKMAKLRVVALSYFIASLCGYVAAFIPYMPLAAGVGVALTIAIMLMTGNPHPPAAGMTLSFIFTSAGFLHVFYVTLFILMLLVLLKFVIHMYRAGEHIEKFKHERG